ncbi:MAG: tetratricopeptide repeat protein [Spirochaetales bacterium]|nr:tetratricopeptide repeat protein [Spirochaetales bacterium]
MKRRFSVKPLLLILALTGCFFSCTLGPEEEVLVGDYYNLARDFQDLGEYDRAEYYYKLCLERTPDDRQSRYNLALMYLTQGEADRALDQLKKLHHADEAQLSVMNSMAIAYSLKEEWEEALSWYDKVLEQFPWDETALYNGALIYTKMEKPEESLAWLEKLWERDKSYQTAMALWDRTGELSAEERLVYLEGAESSDEDELTELYKKKFDLYWEVDLKEEALLLADTLKTADPDNAGLYWFKEGEILLEQYRLEEGLAAVREAFRKGFQDEAELTALLDQLAPSYREVLEELEGLYFPD